MSEDVDAERGDEGERGLADAMRASTDRGELDALIARVPYAEFLGLATAELDGELVLKMPFAERLVGDSTIPALHGGTLGALLESTAIFTVLRATDRSRLPLTATLTVDYLRSGRAEPTFARARLKRLGRRIATVSVEAWQSDPDRPVATASVHFVLRPVAPEL